METDQNTSFPMGDWTSQNWMKNNQQQQEQQEKKAMHKIAAELAVKKQMVRPIEFQTLSQF